MTRNEPQARVAGSYRPPASSASVRSRMSQQRSKDTAPEVEVRKALHARGVRFRTDVKLEPDMRTRADIAWRGMKLAVFVDGCFWHGCTEHATRPAANREWWANKLDANIARDRRTDAALQERGWTVRRYWEHEAPSAIAEDIVTTIERLRTAQRH
ncbi:very short patch repair endonuclease [Gordonia sp. i37]|uniref:very short patch repair endonuclease n=1 Tax=Gordonia sp. i37 TaxID=1961707 RepID=UPI0009AD053A|nr:very short patch repair endonuclease [Gordonia sp. i37]OPX17064.1 very short patch repair endonuclease [Gordonia sp. i37]